MMGLFKIKRIILSGFVGLISLAGPGSFPASGYEAITVVNGATVTGKVSIKGPIPPPRMFLLSLSPFGNFCEKISDGKGRIRLEEFTVGHHNGLQDVIVVIQGVVKGKPFNPINAEFFATDCMFHPADVAPNELYEMDHKGMTHHIHPLVTVIQNGQSIKVVNRDPIFHNGQVFQKERGNILLNFPLPISGEPGGGILHFDPGKRIAQMICGMHEFMQTWGFAVDNPYYAKTKRDGRFVIEQLPPGNYKILAWHPHFKPIEKDLTIPANGMVSVDFDFDASGVKRRTYESEEGTRTLQ